MTPTATEPQSPPSSEPAGLEWTDWPARRNLAWTVVLAALVLLAGIVVAWRIQSYASGLLALVLLLVTLLNYLLPVHYHITPEGLQVRGLGGSSQVRWSRIDVARLGETQAVLKLMREAGRRAREIRVPLGDNPEAVRAQLRQRLLEAGAPLA